MATGRAMVKFKWGLASLCGLLLLLGTVDFALNLERAGRFAAWVPLVLLGCGILWLVYAALSRSYTYEGVAAALEKTFPSLDNRLINFLQFSRDAGKDVFKSAYLRRGAPDLGALNLRDLHDRKAHKRSLITFMIVAALLASPGAFYGKPWFIALWRTLNPFSHVELPTLTKIVSVTPGDKTVLVGESTLLTCTVHGFRGHEVLLDLSSSDGPGETVSLGNISSDNPEDFSRELPRAATQVKYRFRAGDARPSDWFTLDTIPPPSFNSIKALLTPPPHTKLPPLEFDLQKDQIAAPKGSTIRIQVQTSTDFEGIDLSGAIEGATGFSSGEGDRHWVAEGILTEGASIKLAARDSNGVILEEDITVSPQADTPPEIRVLAPTAASILPQGARPQIHFEISDDFGIASVEVQRLEQGEAGAITATPIETWDSKSSTAFNKIWNAEVSGTPGKSLLFRVVARDNNPETPGETLSEQIVFNTPTTEELLEEKKKLEATAAAGLDGFLDLQKTNLAHTTALVDAPDTATQEKWTEAEGRQKEVRELLKTLLDNPLQPLGALADAAKRIYVNESSQAIEALALALASEGKAKEESGREAIKLQTEILRQFSSAESSMSEATKDRRLSSLAAMLTSLIKGQKTLLDLTSALIESKGKASEAMVDDQDALSEDVTAFVRAAGEASSQTSSFDAAFAESVTHIAERVGQLGIQNDMVFAAERLDQGRLDDAVELESKALKNLQSLRSALDEIKVTEKNEKNLELLDAVGVAKEKLEKIQDLHNKMREAIELVKTQENHDTKLVDQMEDEFQEMVKNTKQALLEVPTDLHIFADMNTTNDLVEDVFTIFQEIEQIIEEEKPADEAGAEESDITEKGYAKEDPLMAKMGEAEERLDACETWLGDEADKESITTEAIDLEEMPDSGIAMAELATAAEDLVGDLLQESEEDAEEADDSATNHAMGDFPSGWETKEGNIASFGAQGKSGNTAPDHKEQDGRSNVGRQGMASGETAAGSGTIGKGDDNIQNRRGQDPLQSGKVDAEGEADAVATGGGKLASGKADDVGMSGGTRRMDSTEEGSWEGMAAIMAEKADAMYAEASLKNVRVDSLKTAAHHIRQSADAVANGNISQMREFRQMAAKELLQASAQLQAGPSQSLEVNRRIDVLDGVIESGSDAAPPQFRDKVSEYFKALNETL